ncbi:hypothetical protein YC2023_111170 [Brassica napus]
MMIACSRYLYLTSCFESHIHYIISQRLNNPYRKYGSKISGVKIKRSPPGQGRQVINNIRNILLCFWDQYSPSTGRGDDVKEKRMMENSSTNLVK